MENSFLPTIYYESIIQNFPDPFWIIDAKELIVAGINAAYCEMSGFTESEIIGKSAEEFELQKNESDTADRIRLIVKTKKLRYNAGHRKKDGSTARVEVTAHYENIGEKGFIFAFMRDCSERLELEDKFQELNSKLINTATNETQKRITKELAFATIFEALSAGLAIVDKDGFILDVNKRFLSLFGLTNKFLTLKQNFIDFAIEEDDEGIKHRQNIINLLHGANCGCLLKAECAESEHKQCEAAFKMGCGKRVDAVVGVSCYKIGFEGAHFIFSITDVTQIKALEKKERQVSGLLASQNRMAAMGEMIGAISHQWRQPLNILGVLVQELPELFEENALTKEAINKIVFDSMKQIYFMGASKNPQSTNLKPKSR